MSYIRCLRGLASGVDYPADQAMNLDPVDGRPVEMVLGVEVVNPGSLEKYLPALRNLLYPAST